MGDHFVLLVDRLLTESTLEAAIERENRLQQSTLSASHDNMISSHQVDVNIRSSSSKLVECRICHDEDEDLNMETPCSCRGSLKVSLIMTWFIARFWFNLYKWKCLEHFLLYTLLYTQIKCVRMHRLERKFVLCTLLPYQNVWYI